MMQLIIDIQPKNHEYPLQLMGQSTCLPKRKNKKKNIGNGEISSQLLISRTYDQIMDKFPDHDIKKKTI